MNILNDKLNELTNELAVTEDSLMEAIVDKPEGFDTDLYLSIQAVLQDKLRVNHKEIKNMLVTLLNRNKTEDIESFLKITKKDFDLSEEKESLVSRVFGKYMLAKGYVLLNQLDKILKYKSSIEAI